MGVSLFTGRLEGFLLIWVAGARTETNTETESQSVWNEPISQKHTQKAAKNFLWSLSGLHVQSNWLWAAGSDVGFCLDLKDSAQK